MVGGWGVDGRRNEECRACLMDCVHLSAVCAERNPMAHSLRFLPYCRTQREYMNMGLLLLAGGLARRDSRARAGRCFYTRTDNWLTVPGPCLHGLPWPGLACLVPVFRFLQRSLAFSSTGDLRFHPPSVVAARSPSVSVPPAK